MSTAEVYIIKYEVKDGRRISDKLKFPNIAIRNNYILLSPEFGETVLEENDPSSCVKDELK